MSPNLCGVYIRINVTKSIFAAHFSNRALCSLQVLRLILKTSSLDSTLPHASSWKLWVGSWAIKTQRSPWCFLCTDGLVLGKTLLVNSLPKTFSRKEWTANMSMFSHLNYIFHIQVSLIHTRYEGKCLQCLFKRSGFILCLPWLFHCLILFS